MDVFTVSYKDALATSILAIEAGLVPILMGPPGEGKTALRLGIRQALNLEGDVLIKPSNYDTVDFTGIPFIEDGMTYFAPNGDILPGKRAPETGLVTLDEVGDATTPVQNVLCQVIEERRMGSYRLPAGWHVYLTSNRVEDRAGANRLVSKLVSRVCLMQLAYTLQDYTPHAINQDFHELTIAYPNFAPQHLNTFDPKIDNQPYACPRTWEKTSKVLKIDDDMDKPHVFAAINGLLGHGIGGSLRMFSRIAKKMVKFDTIVADPKGAPVPKEREIQYMLVTSFIKHITAKTVTQVRTYMERIGQDELEAYLLKSLVETRLKDMTKAGTDFAKYCADKKHLIC